MCAMQRLDIGYIWDYRGVIGRFFGRLLGTIPIRGMIIL